MIITLHDQITDINFDILLLLSILFSSFVDVVHVPNMWYTDLTSSSVLLKWDPVNKPVQGKISYIPSFV